MMVSFRRPPKAGASAMTTSRGLVPRSAGPASEILSLPLAPASDGATDGPPAEVGADAGAPAPTRAISFMTSSMMLLSVFSSIVLPQMLSGLIAWRMFCSCAHFSSEIW